MTVNDTDKQKAPESPPPQHHEREGDSIEQAKGRGEKREGNRVETRPTAPPK